MDKVSGSILTAFEQFFTAVSKKYNLDKTKVKNACIYGVTPLAPVSVKTPVSVKGLKNSSILDEAKNFVSNDTPMGKMTVDKLKEMCRAKNLKLSGRKDDLINRLENPTLKENKVGVTTKKKKSLFKPNDVSKIVEKLRGAVSRLAVRKNSHGHYVHLETNLVFDPIKQKVIGRWKDDQVKWLTKQDLEMCLELGVLYELPENLNLGVIKVVDKKVEEMLGEDDFKDVTDDEEEEEEDVSGDEDY
jgi:hypothetical protein